MACERYYATCRESLSTSRNEFAARDFFLDPATRSTQTRSRALALDRERGKRARALGRVAQTLRVPRDRLAQFVDELLRGRVRIDAVDVALRRRASARSAWAAPDRDGPPDARGCRENSHGLPSAPRPIITASQPVSSRMREVVVDVDDVAVADHRDVRGHRVAHAADDLADRSCRRSPACGCGRAP